MLLTEAASDREDLALSILEAKTRAAELTKGLLTFAHRRMISLSELAIHEVVAECEPLLKSLVGDKVRLKIFADPTPPVTADRNQVEQCLVNLLVNAKDALGSGGVVRVHTAGPGP
jgi:two-component system cell cycle sensor histidine kinase/response regulator CckA